MLATPGTAHSTTGGGVGDSLSVNDVMAGSNRSSIQNLAIEEVVTHANGATEVEEDAAA